MFRIGDRVTIARKWTNGKFLWLPEMDWFVGKSGIIQRKEQASAGYSFRIDFDGREQTHCSFHQNSFIVGEEIIYE